MIYRKSGTASVALIVLFSIGFLFSCASGPAERAGSSSALDGSWAGVMSVGDQTLKATVHIFEGGALLDVPEQGLWSYPLGTVSQTKDSVSFELALGEAPWPVTLSLNTVYLEGSFGTNADETTPRQTEAGEPAPAGEGSSVTAVQGRFSLMRLEAAGPANPLAIPVEGGFLRGELDLFTEDSNGPLVIIVPDSGSVDRHGNILGVGGKGDSYKLLSAALRSSGISCFRYDKRGVAESYPILDETAKLRFSDYVTDLNAILDRFRRDTRFSSVTLLGHGEGALVAAAALQDLDKKGSPVSFFALSPQSLSVQELLRIEVRSYGPESLVEFERVLADILAGGTGEPLPDFLMDVFTPDMLNYWRSWMQYDPVALYAAIRAPLFLVRGTNETVCTVEDIERLAAANETAEYLLIPGMNQVFKDGLGDQNALYEAYLDTERPLSAALIEALVGFVRGK